MELQPPICPATLHELATLVDRYTGLRFIGPRRKDLARGIQTASRDLGFDSESELIHWILDPSQCAERVLTLAQHLTIGETYFFRDPPLFRFLEEELLPGLMQASAIAGRPIRIWSAGCSSGEECYSIAIAAHRVLGSAAAECVEIIGTDINHQAVQRAREGVYRNWSFRDIPAPDISRYFTPGEGGGKRVSDEIRAMVRFRNFNLGAAPVEPEVPIGLHGCDIIFCRNVLMYLSGPAASKAVTLFSRALVDGGLLIAGPADVTSGSLLGFTAVLNPAGVLFRKDIGTETPLGGAAFPDGLEPPSIKLGTPLNPSPTRDTGAAGDPFSNQESQSLRTGDAWKSNAPGTPASPDNTTASTCDNETQDPKLDRAMLLANRHRLDEALEATGQLLVGDECNVEILYAHATLLVEADRLDEAKRYFARLIYLDPELVAVEIALGHLATRSGVSDHASRHFANAAALLERMPSEAIVRYTGGVAVHHLLPMMRQLVTKH